MPNIIPVPVNIVIGVIPVTGNENYERKFGSFSILPYATNRNGGLDISRWVIHSGGEFDELDEASLFSIMPKKLLHHICKYTFESEVDSIKIYFQIDDQKWYYPMSAQELEYDQVHYMVEIDGEWHKMTEVPVSEVISEEQLIFAEREVLPSIDFGDPQSVFDEMN